MASSNPATGGERDGDRPAPLVERVARVLRVFDADHRSLSLSDTALRSGLPLTTTHRLVRSLTAAGYLEREPTGNYHIGLRLWAQAAPFCPAARIVGAGREPLPSQRVR